jgi:hypothetical protein
MFNQIYNQESSCRQSRAGDAMILETANAGYKNRTRGSEFKWFHWWEAMRHQPKWRAKSPGLSATDSWISSSDPTTEEEVTHHIGRDRAKAATQKGKGKGKGKKGSSSQSESSSTVGCMMSTLKKLSTSFAKIVVEAVEQAQGPFHREHERGGIKDSS